MIVVIIAGGSGTRLWPLSTADYPKHLLKVNSDTSSLLQRTVARGKRLTSKVYVVSEVSHIRHVKRQLPELPKDSFIVEPGRRGTANCILAALVIIQAKHDPDEPIAFMHADHYIRDVSGFVQSFRMAAAVAKSEKRIVLVGIEPDKPETGFGYIEKGAPLAEHSLVYNVASFTEKPDFNTASKYLRSGNYLWNGGYFVGSARTFVEAMTNYAPDLQANYEQLLSASAAARPTTYLGFENMAIDYALIEKVPNLLVAPASFDWMDLGSFNDMHKAVGSDQDGNHVEGAKVGLEQVTNSFIQNHEDKPIVIIGLDHVVVVNTPHGLVIARKDMSQNIGALSKRLTDD